MLATYSNENQINLKLQDLDCKLVHFANGPARGVVGRTRLTEALLGGRPLDQSDANKLLELLSEMAALKNTVLTTLDWSDTEGIRAMLQAKREFKRALEHDEIQELRHA